MKTPDGVLENQLIDMVVANLSNKSDLWAVDGECESTMVWINVDDGLTVTTSPYEHEGEDGISPYVEEGVEHPTFEITLEVELDDGNKEFTHKFTHHNGSNLHTMLMSSLNPVDSNMSSMADIIRNINTQHGISSKSGKRLSREEIEKMYDKHLESTRTSDGSHNANINTLSKDTHNRVIVTWK